MLFLINIKMVYAEEEDSVDLTDFPDKLSEALGIPLFPSQLLSSAILMAIFMFPALALTRGKDTQFLILLIFGNILMGVCIALTWLPYWFILILILLIAGIWSAKFKGWLG